MDDAKLFALVKAVDPQAVRLPPGIKAIADRIEEEAHKEIGQAMLEEREACASICDALEAGDCAISIRARPVPSSPWAQEPQSLAAQVASSRLLASR